MRNLEKIKAVVFDLDDTLISEKQYIESGFRHVAEVLSSKLCISKQIIFEMLMNLFNASPKNVFDRLFDKLQIRYSKKDILKLVEEYRNHTPDIQFYDDVLPCLKQLKNRGIKTGVITDGYISTQRNKLKVLNAEKYFDHIIVTEELGREYWKPHPRAFEVMRNVLKIEFNEMVYVGDNPVKDFYIASNYPIKTVRIYREDSIYRNEPYYKNLEETFRIFSLLELNTLFFAD